MKKSLIVLLSLMVVLAFAASAFALHQVKAGEYTPGLVKSGKSQIELGGEIRIRGDVKKNGDFRDGEDQTGYDTTQAYDQRVRLSTKANVTDKTFGFVELETGNNSHDSASVECAAHDNDEDGIVEEGEIADCTTTNTADSNNSKNTYGWGGTNQKKGGLYLRQAYISHQFGMIGGLKAGHMLLGLGNRLFFDHTNYGDDAIILWASVGPGELSLIDIKLEERTNGVKLQNDDWEGYIASLEMPLNAINASGDVTYLRDRATTTYDDGENFYNIGLRANADLKVVKVKGDVEIQGGKAKKSAADAFGNTEKKYKGLAAMLGVEAAAGPATIRGGAGYGSGDKVKNDGDSEGKDEAFRTFLTDNQYTTFIYDYTVMGASGSTNKGLTNTLYVNVGASVKPIADLKVSADFYYLRAAKEVALKGARKAAGTPCTNNGNCDTSKKLGYEVDAKIEYQLASNLAYYIEAGYLFAGDAYDRYDSVKGDNQDADNPYRVRHGLLLQF